MRLLFIVNRRSGRPGSRGSIEATIESFCRTRGLDFRIIPATGVAALDHDIPEAINNGFDVICAVGGDGTVSEIGRRLIGTPAALGIIPTGSGNGLARHLGIPLTPEGALQTIAGGTRHRIDTGSVNGLSFLVTCGFGLDAVIAHRFATSARGLVSYLKLGAGAWFTRRLQRFRADVDGSRLEISALLATVANANQYGSDARVAPRASVRDGKLDLVFVGDPALHAIPALLFRLFRGTFDESPLVKVTQGKMIRIERESAGPAHIDGEPVDLPATLEIEVRLASLEVVAPAGRAI